MQNLSTNIRETYEFSALHRLTMVPGFARTAIVGSGQP